MAVSAPELTALLRAIAVGNAVAPNADEIASIASVAAERSEITRVATVVRGLHLDGSQGVARRVADKYSALWA